MAVFCFIILLCAHTLTLYSPLLAHREKSSSRCFALHSPHNKKLTRAAAFFLLHLASHNLSLHSFFLHNALLCNSFHFSAATLYHSPMSIKNLLSLFLFMDFFACCIAKKNITFFFIAVHCTHSAMSMFSHIT